MSSFLDSDESGNSNDPIISKIMLNPTLINPICSPGNDIPKNDCIGDNPSMADNPPNNAINAPIELAFFQYNPPINNAIAPVK